jgi:hypothetical protein
MRRIIHTLTVFIVTITVYALAAMLMEVMALDSAVILAVSALAQTPCAAPPLPFTGRRVDVATEAALQTAVRNAARGDTIVIAPGLYTLSNTLQMVVPDLTIRGATDRCDEVILVGQGMANANYGNVPHGIWVGNAPRPTIANLTIRNVYFHPIQLDPNQGADQPHIYNVRLVDAGQQFIKSSARTGGGTGVSNGVVEYAVLEYTTTARSYYTNGIDVHGGAGWIIRQNRFRNIQAPSGQLAGPAVLMWNGSRDTITEGNQFVNCARGIAYGLGGGRSDDHVGGIIRNNMLSRTANQPGDVGIVLENSANTKVLHNTVILSGTYANAIEYRFAATTGVEIRSNLLDGAVRARDGAQGSVAANVTTATAAFFVNAAAGDLHLLSSATAAIDKATLHASVTSDYDGQARPVGSQPDIGADEYAPSGVDPQPLEPPRNLRRQ